MDKPPEKPPKWLEDALSEKHRTDPEFTKRTQDAGARAYFANVVVRPKIEAAYKTHAHRVLIDDVASDMAVLALDSGDLKLKSDAFLSPELETNYQRLQQAVGNDEYVRIMENIQTSIEQALREYSSKKNPDRPLN